MTARMKPDRDIVEELVGGAVWAREVRAFLALRTDIVADGPDLRVRFASSIAAEQFKKLLTSRRGRVSK